MKQEQRKISYKQSLKDATVVANCFRREKAINIMKQKGVKRFAIYVTTKNVPLSEGQYFSNVTSVNYLCSDEFYNNSCLVKMILDKVDSGKIIKLIDLAKSQYLPGLLPDLDLDLDSGANAQSFNSTNHVIKQHINDPLSLLLALIMHPNSQLFTLVIEQLPQLKNYIALVHDLFLFNGNIDHLKRIVNYANINDDGLALLNKINKNKF